MGLLTRGPRGATRTGYEARMTVIEHLEDLRRALIIIAAVWLVCSVAAWFFTVDILRFVEHRANFTQPIQFPNPTGAFMLRFRIALYAGTLAASPIIFWQLWW